MGGEGEGVWVRKRMKWKVAGWREERERWRWRLHNEMHRGEHSGFVSPTSALCMTEANMTLMEFDPAEQWARG